MNSQQKLSGEIEDPMLGEALSHFKASIDAWSEAAYRQPRTVAGMNRHSWRLAATWALGCLLAFGCLAGGIYERFHSQDLARVAALKAAEQKAAGERLARVEKLAAAEKALEQREAKEQADAATRSSDPNEDLLATLDSDVSREVPAAMEPLAQLMDDSGAKDNGTN
jgi:hypothetical protein